MLKSLTAIAALVAACMSPAAGTTLIVNGSGELTGATGVVINGSTYNVTFAEGSCAGLFGGCTTVSDFTFQSLGDAQAAAQALLDQVLIDSGQGQFDTDYSLTFGCGTNNGLACAVLIPYATDGSAVSVAEALNTPTTDLSSVQANPSINFDTSGGPQYVYALFTSAAAVPEPSTWLLMLMGFGAIGMTVRRKGQMLGASG